MGNYVESNSTNPNLSGRQVHTRKLDRLVAHVNMKRAGLTKVNKHDHVGYAWQRRRINSYFANHWREYVNVPTIDLRRKSNG